MENEKVVMLSEKDLDNIKIGDKYNLGNERFIEVIGFEKGTSQRRWTPSGFIEEQSEMIACIVNGDTKLRYHKNVFLNATKNLDKTITSCTYCKTLNYPSNIKFGVIINRKWKNTGFRSPQRPYCKDTDCHAKDQMSHEG